MPSHRQRQRLGGAACSNSLVVALATKVTEGDVPPIIPHRRLEGNWKPWNGDLHGRHRRCRRFATSPVFHTGGWMGIGKVRSGMDAGSLRACVGGPLTSVEPRPPCVEEPCAARCNGRGNGARQSEAAEAEYDFPNRELLCCPVPKRDRRTEHAEQYAEQETIENRANQGCLFVAGVRHGRISFRQRANLLSSP